MAAQRVNEALLAHILDNGLGRVERALVFVVLQQVFKNLAEHFRVNADLVVVGVVLVNREIVLAEKFQQVRKEFGREINFFHAVKVAFKQAAVEIRDARAGDFKKVVRTLAVERVEIQRDEAAGVEAFLFGLGGGVEK